MRRILLDENLPKPLIKHFSINYKIDSVSDLNWQSKKNGELLEAMAREGIDILLTVDKNLQFQQNLDKYPVQIILLLTLSNRYKSIVPQIPLIESEIIKSDASDKLIVIDIR